MFVFKPVTYIYIYIYLQRLVSGVDRSGVVTRRELRIAVNNRGDCEAGIRTFDRHGDKRITIGYYYSVTAGLLVALYPFA